MAFRPASYEFFAALPFPHEKTVKTSIASDRPYFHPSNNRCRVRSPSQKTLSTPRISQTRTLASASRPASRPDPRQHSNSQPHSFSPRRSHILSRQSKSGISKDTGQFSSKIKNMRRCFCSASNPPKSSVYQASNSNSQKVKNSNN